MKSAHKKAVLGKVIIYAILILIAVVMIIPFLWMLSASIKSDREVFQMNPFVWIPANPKWDNYVKIWTKIPFGRFVGNTVYLTLIVTFLQLLTSSFAAYSFAKLDFRHKNGLFLAYIATIAMPWQVYMVPQFIMMRRMGLNDKLLAMICLQAFSAFGVFMMKQFYEGVPTELCEAAESLMQSEEWKKATDELIALQARWKQIGAVSRRHSDAVWKRFRAACDRFFERKSAHFAGVDGEHEENLRRKLALLDEMAAADVRAGGYEVIRDFQRRWGEIGFVPIRQKEAVQKRYKAAVDELFAPLRGSERDRSMSRFREKVSAFKASGDRRIRTERDRLYNRVKQLESDIALLENNIGFFAHTNGAAALLADVRAKIERAKREMADTIEKVKLLAREAARESEDREA